MNDSLQQQQIVLSFMQKW